MKKRYVSLLAACILVASLAACASAAPRLLRILPANNEVKGFKIFPDSLTYGRGSDITNTYDGGYGVYTKHGVVDAARRMYERGKDYVEVTVHTLKTEATARAFLKYWARERRAGRVIRRGRETCFTLTKPNVMAYCQAGKYFFTVSAYYAPDAAKKDVQAFVNAVSKKVFAKR